MLCLNCSRPRISGLGDGRWETTVNKIQSNKATRGGFETDWADRGETTTLNVDSNSSDGESEGIELTAEGAVEINNSNSQGAEEIDSTGDREEDSNSVNSTGSEVGNDEVDGEMEVGKKIRLGAWNAEGLFEKLGLNGVCEYINTLDVACLGETFTFPTFDFNVKFSDFVALHSPAKKFNIRGRPSGGLVILIRKTLEQFITIIDTKISHVLCFKLAKEYLNTAKDLLFIGTYVHPADSVFYTEEDHDCTLEAIEQFMLDQLEEEDDFSYLLAGDLNARIGDWGLSMGEAEEEEEEGDAETIDRNSQDGVVNENGQKLIQICTAFNATPLNGIKDKNFDDKFTFIGRRGNSTIDHFVCSADILGHVSEYKTMNRVESQHMPIEMELSSREGGTGEGTSGLEEAREINVSRWKEEKREECTNILNKDRTTRAIEEAETVLEGSIDEGLDSFDKIMKDINKPMSSSYKTGGTKEVKKKWFNKECEVKKKEAKQALIKMSKINAKRRKEDYKRAKDNYLDKRIIYQKTVRERRKQYKKEMQDKLVDTRYDAKTFWGEIRKISFKRPKLANITINQWEEHFKQVFNTGRRGIQPEGEREARRVEERTLEIDGERGRGPRELEEESEGEVEELDEEISREEIINGIDKLKKGKSSGLDEISAELLQMSKGKILEFLFKLFNKMFMISYFPLRWAVAIVVPLHKKGDVNIADNYRGISLLSITSKIFTGILNRRLYNWAEENDKINIEQAGFRRSHSTIDHIFTLHSMISNCLYGRRRSKFYVCFVDFKKAFDTVNREKLWEVLERHGVTDRMLNMIKAIYQKVTAIVRYGSQVTEEIDCPLGVRQGCLLSPLLFTLLITELAQEIAREGMHGYQFNPGFIELFTLLFADDIALMATTPRGLQNQIDRLRRGAERLGLVVNLEKTKVMVFRKGGFLGRLERWYYGEERIEVVNRYKYLGYTLTTKLSVDIALAEYAGKAKGRIVSIFRALYKLGKIDLGVFFKLFDCQVKPILLYGAEIWGMKGREIIEKVHLFACKKLLGVSTKTPNSFIYFELNRYPLYVDARMKVFKYWAKLLNLEEGRLPRQAYNRECRELDKVNGWGMMLREYLVVNGFGNIWEEQNGDRVLGTCKEFKQRQIDNFWQTEHSNMEESQSRRFVEYLSYKEDHNRELYLKEIRVPKFRKALTRFRFGVNDLRGNRKYLNPQANRKCPFCVFDETNDHFLLKCPAYNDLRSKYLLQFWITLNNVHVKDLVCNVNPDVVKNTAIFIFYALQYRERH